MTHYLPTLATRERILLIGGPGAGKSYACFDVARRVLEAGADVHVVDNDQSIERLVELEGGDMNVDRLHVTDVFPEDWEPLVAAVHDASNNATRDDLLVIDSMTPTWPAAQEFFTDQIFDKGLDEYFLDARKSLKAGKLDTFDGWRDWSVINKIYSRLYRAINRFPGHVMLTAEADPIGSDAPKELRMILGTMRVKPRGQKHLAYRVNTLVQLAVERDGTRSMLVGKDRGRDTDTEPEEIHSFFRSYMVGRAEWRKADD